MANSQTLAEALKGHFGSALLKCTVANHEVTVEVAPERLIEVCEQLKTDNRFGFEILVDLCGVDYSTYGQDEWATKKASSDGFSRAVNTDAEVAKDEPGRFAVVYHLLSVANNHRLRVRCFTNETDMPRVPSVIPVWNTANWYEREAFDLYGILFEGHPDLRRLLTDYGFIGHPFRKDFPLSGQVEMRYDPEQGRVVYEPVSIEPRVLVPRVIRHDHRYQVHETADRNKDSDTDA